MTIRIADQLLEKKASLAVVGLGYVGLPIAVAFAKKGIKVIGFDVNEKKISGLKKGVDPTGETTPEDLKSAASNIIYSSDEELLKGASFLIVAVPTPIDEHKTPDLGPLIKASETIGRNLNRKSIIVYESTVYPGVTEEICVPIIEKESVSSWKNGDFFVGYSPERINPGDKEHTLEKIVKVVSGQNEEICGAVAAVYDLVVKAGTYKAESIKVAEAAKVIENTQRDLNIALMNELAVIFHKIGIDTEAVLKAAGTKWNFLKFHPGLVGGHCIGVDPYYLTCKAEQLGYHSQVVLAGRRINDSMGVYVAQETVKQMVRAKKIVEGAKVLILGFTFKENVPDFRNSRVADIVRELKSYGTNVCVYDPFISFAGGASTFRPEFEAEIVDLTGICDMDALILATPHDVLKKISLAEYKKYCRLNNGKPVFIDVRGVFGPSEAEKTGFHYWRL